MRRDRKRIYSTYNTARVRLLQFRNATLQSFDSVNQETEDVFEARTGRLGYIREEGLVLDGCLIWISVVSFPPMNIVGGSNSRIGLKCIDSREIRAWYGGQEGEEERTLTRLDRRQVRRGTALTGFVCGRAHNGLSMLRFSRRDMRAQIERQCR